MLSTFSCDFWPFAVCVLDPLPIFKLRYLFITGLLGNEERLGDRKQRSWLGIVNSVSLELEGKVPDTRVGEDWRDGAWGQLKGACEALSKY